MELNGAFNMWERVRPPPERSEGEELTEFVNAYFLLFVVLVLYAELELEARRLLHLVLYGLVQELRDQGALPTLLLANEDKLLV